MYSIIWAEPAKAQAEAWQHHANEIDHTGGPRPLAAAPLFGSCNLHGGVIPPPVRLLAPPTSINTQQNFWLGGGSDAFLKPFESGLGP